MTDHSDAAKKVVMVIGGARGIGASVCREFLQDGYNVACTHLGHDADKKGSGELRSLADSVGCGYLDAAVDCTDNDQTVAFVELVRKTYGGIGNLVYCAGYTSPVPFEQLDIEQWRRIVDINLNGAFIAVHAVLPAMLCAGGGIVLIGSAAITSGGGGRADYVSAKAGLEGLNLAITKEFAPKGIRCNLVHPSLIETDLLRHRYPDEAQRAQVAKGVPVGRLGQPEDVAHVVKFLLSDKAGYLAGQSILVDGGRSYCG